MGRIPRKLLVEPDSTNHVMWRCHNHTRLFEDRKLADYFLELLATYKGKYGIKIHSFCLMHTHPHVVMTSTLGQQAFSDFWKVVNQRLAYRFNQLNDRRGQVVMERVRSPAIQRDGRHLLTVMRYGDLNPVRAKLCRSAGRWPLSSHRHYAFGERHPLIDDAPDYVALGSNPAQRRRAYQGLFGRNIAQELMKKRDDLVSVPFIGSDCWVESQLRKLEAPAAVPDG